MQVLTGTFSFRCLSRAAVAFPRIFKPRILDDILEVLSCVLVYYHLGSSQAVKCHQE